MLLISSTLAFSDVLISELLVFSKFMTFSTVLTAHSVLSFFESESCTVSTLLEFSTTGLSISDSTQICDELYV
jgi:hypothetical protein